MGNEGVGSPYDHLADQAGVPGRGDQSGDSTVAPPEQRELAKTQRLPKKWGIISISKL